MDFVIENMKDEDWLDVKTIYEEGIATGDATFDIEAPSWEQWDKSHLAKGRLVVKLSDEVACKLFSP